VTLDPQPAPVDPRPALEALVVRGRELQSSLRALQERLEKASGFRWGEKVAIHVDDRGLPVRIDLSDDWRAGGEQAMAALIDAAFSSLAVPDAALVTGEALLERLRGLPTKPTAVSDSLGEVTAHALHGKVFRVSWKPRVLAAATDDTIAGILVDLSRRAALETDVLGRYAQPIDGDEETQT
jgi:hypothetical protein